MFSRYEILSGNIRFSGAYLEDELFLIEYFAAPKRLVSLDAPLYRYFPNSASVTRRYLPGYTDTFLATLHKKAALIERFFHTGAAFLAL